MEDLDLEATTTQAKVCTEETQGLPLDKVGSNRLEFLASTLKSPET